MNEVDIQGWSGRRVEGARRIRYVGPDSSVSSDGPLELSFDDGSVRVLDAGADGESLRISDGAWRDPFAPPQSAQNAEFLSDAGRWTAFDLAGQPPWDALLGVTLQIRPIRDSSGRKLIGANISAGPMVVDVHVDSDELVVTINHRSGHRPVS